MGHALAGSSRMSPSLRQHAPSRVYYAASEETEKLMIHISLQYKAEVTILVPAEFKLCRDISPPEPRLVTPAIRDHDTLFPIM